MQEQNFEKQVHKILEDLAVPPSPPVWNKVEEQIRKKNDRRRIILWLLPLILVTTGFLWFIISSENKFDTTKSSDISSTTLPQEKNNLQKPFETNENNNFENKTSTRASTENTVLLNNKKEIIISTTDTKHIPIKENKNQTPIVSNKLSTSETEVNQTFVTKAKSEKISNVNVTNEQLTINNIDSFKTETTPLTQTENDQFIKDSSETDKANAETEVTDKEEVIEKNIKPIISSKWKLVPYLAGGYSSISKGLFDPVATADFATPGNTSGSGSFVPPPVPEKNLYFSAGVRMAKTLNERFEISTGLQYSYFSSKTNIGTRVFNDTTVLYSNVQVRLQDYYQNGNTDKYTNSYHFISLPAAIEYQLLKNVPLSLQAGVSLNQLVSTNALINRNSNMQYENDKAWNKTQLHAFTGLQFHFLKNKSFSFKTGPFIQYSITGLEKDSNRKQFLSVAGLQTYFYFNK